MLAKNTSDFFTKNVEGFMEEEEFERYCIKEHGYKFTGHEDCIRNCKEMAGADEDGDKYYRQTQYFNYEKGENTIQVRYYEYSSKIDSGGYSILGYSIIEVIERKSIWLK